MLIFMEEGRKKGDRGVQGREKKAGYKEHRQQCVRPLSRPRLLLAPHESELGHRCPKGHGDTHIHLAYSICMDGAQSPR